MRRLFGRRRARQQEQEEQQEHRQQLQQQERSQERQPQQQKHPHRGGPQQPQQQEAPSHLTAREASSPEPAESFRGVRPSAGAAAHPPAGPAQTPPDSSAAAQQLAFTTAAAPRELIPPQSPSQPGPQLELHTTGSGRQLWRLPTFELQNSGTAQSPGYRGAPLSPPPPQHLQHQQQQQVQEPSFSAARGGPSAQAAAAQAAAAATAWPLNSQIGMATAASPKRSAAMSYSTEDTANADQRHHAAGAGAAGGPKQPPPPLPQQQQQQQQQHQHQQQQQQQQARRVQRVERRDDRRDTAPETPFLAPPLQNQQMLYQPSTGGGVAAHRAASRASSVTVTTAGVPYSGKVDLELNVAVVGAGVTGLATALALKRIHPRLRVRVFDRRPALAGPDRKYGSYCRLEPNGLRAAAAIDPRLRQAILRHGLRARPVLIHDTDGSLITRLEERSTGAMRRFGEPYVTIGWYELEQALLSLLPPDTVQYGAQYTGHRERDDATYITFRRTGPSASRGGPATALPGQLQPPQTPSPDKAPAGAAAAAAPSAASSFPSLVRSGFLVACDGPFSDVRKRVVRDGDPQYDGVVKWLGRLPGDDVPSLPLDFNAVWLSPGRTFLSHSLAGGDVAWEAVVTDPDLRELGFRYNTVSKRVERVMTPLRTASLRSASLREPSLGVPKPVAPGRRPPYGGLEDTARRLFAGGIGHSPVSDAAGSVAAAAPPPDALHGDVPYDGAAGVATPAADVSYLDSEELRSDEEEGGGEEGEGSEEEGEEDARGKGEVLQKLLTLFAAFPPEVRAMLRNSRPSCVVETGVWVRRAKDLPSALGRGRVLILGEAAHPMRPSSQEENQALEDAAVLGWCVQRHGLNKEALRRYEAERKPRWRHVMQLAMAANSTPSATSSGLSQALLDYNSALHGATFHRLHPPLGWQLLGAARRALWLAALAGAAGGMWLGAAALLQRSGQEQLGPFTAAAALLDDTRRRVAAASVRASKVAAETGSVAAGVAAAREANEAAARAAAAAAAPPPPTPRQRWQWLPWSRRQAAAEVIAETASPEAAEVEELTEAEVERRPWWRVDKLVWRAKAPVAQVSAAVAAPAVVAVEGISDVAGRAKDFVVTRVEGAAVSAAATAAGSVGDVAQRAVQRRISRALGAF